MRVMRTLQARDDYLAFGVSLSVLGGQKLGLNTKQRGERKDKFIMMGMRWTNWVGFLMLVIFLLIHEPI